METFLLSGMGSKKSPFVKVWTWREKLRADSLAGGIQNYTGRENERLGSKVSLACEKFMLSHIGEKGREGQQLPAQKIAGDSLPRHW